jgi:hypothetical protein
MLQLNTLQGRACGPDYAIALKVSAWLLILTHGEPDILGAVVALIERVAS